MTIEKRLQTVEAKAATIPRTLAQLLRESVHLSGDQARKWYASLSEIELTILTSEYERQAAEGILPNFDWAALTDAELERIVDGDNSPLETCPILPTNQQPEATT